MTVSDPPVLGWSDWTRGSAPKSWETRRRVPVASGPAPRPQPATAVVAATAARTVTRPRARVRSALGNGEHHARGAAGQLGRLVAGLVDDLLVEHVAAAAE